MTSSPTLANRSTSHLVKLICALGLLGACQRPAPPPEEPMVSPPAPAPAPAPAGLSSEPRPQPSVEPPVAEIATTPPQLSLGPRSWLQGALLPQQPGADSAPSANGGYPNLNHIAEEAEALARTCACTGDALALSVEEGTSSWQLLSVLGLLRRAGFTHVAVTYQTQRVLFELERPASVNAAKQLRILGGGARWADKPNSLPPLDATQLCQKAACGGVSLSVSEEASLDLWWSAAKAIAESNAPHQVTVELDSLPRPLSPRRAGGRVVGPIAQITFDDVRERLFAEYAPLRACLAENPPTADMPPRLSIEVTVRANGTAIDARLGSPSEPSPLSRCLLTALRKMVFRAPHFGTARVNLPFVLHE